MEASGILRTHFLLCLGNLDKYSQEGKGKWVARNTQDRVETSHFQNHYETNLDSLPNDSLAPILSHKFQLSWISTLSLECGAIILDPRLVS